MTTIWKLLGTVLFWLTWPLIYLYSTVTGPRTRLLLVFDDEVLLVKNWLGSGGWSLPGGGLHRGEQPSVGVLRELKEELGVTFAPDRLIEFGLHIVQERGGLPSKFYLFAAVLEEKPNLYPDGREIVAHDWAKISSLLPKKRGISATVRKASTAWMKHKNLL